MKIIQSFVGIVFFSLITSTVNANQIAFNTFHAKRQYISQDDGFGYSGGGVLTDANTLFGNTFTPTVGGVISDIWIGLDTSYSDKGTDIAEIFLYETDESNMPVNLFASFSLVGEISKYDSVEHIVPEQAYSLEAGERYWLMISAGEGTFGVSWNGGYGSSIEEELYAYSPTKDSPEWRVGRQFSGAGALRIDVESTASVPEPPMILLLSTMLAGLIGSRYRCG